MEYLDHCAEQLGSTRLTVMTTEDFEKIRDLIERACAEGFVDPVERLGLQMIQMIPCQPVAEVTD